MIAGRTAAGTCRDPATAADAEAGHLQALQPMILYKYLSPHRIDVLESGMIRFTQPAAFNDPFESRPHLARQPTVDDLRRLMSVESKLGSVAQKSIDDLLNSDQIDRIAGSLLSTFLRLLSTGTGILSLTEVRDSLLMWAHYGAKHEGFVIGFRTDTTYFLTPNAAPEAAGHTRKVTYAESRPSRSVKELTHRDLYFTKSPEWSYEREWRQYRVLVEARRMIDSHPYPICLFPFPTNAIESIIVGCRATSETFERLKSLVHGDPRFGGARLLKASVDDHAFRLNFSEA